MKVTRAEIDHAINSAGLVATNIPAEAVRLLKRAAIEMVRSTSDPEGLFLATILTDISKVACLEEPTISIQIENGLLKMPYNPNWICYLGEIGTGAGPDGISYIIREIRHELIHLVLMHPEAMASADLNSEIGVVEALSMDIVVNNYLDKNLRYLNYRPPCPACAARMCIKLKDVYSVSAAGRFSNPTCSVCRDSGYIVTDERVVGKIISNHGGRYSSRYSTNVFERGEIRNAIKVAAPSKAYSDLRGLIDPMLVYDSVFSEASVSSLLNHARAEQQRSFNSGSSGGSPLLGMLNELKREKRIPYLLKIRGVLGATMNSEKIATRYRPHRRFGYDYPGTKALPKQRYVFAMDTSGSVPQEQIKKILNEFMNIRDYSDNIEVRVMFFHHSVYYDKDIDSYADADMDALQSGGTNFNNVFERVFDSKEREQGEAVLVIYTDGYCSINFPKRKINGSVYWLLMPKGDSAYIKRWNPNANIIKLHEN